MTHATLWSLWRDDVRDRWAGESARANARWGFLTPPVGPGKLIWVEAGGSRESVLLGVEAVRAVRERRLDVRLALTFQREHRDLLARLRALKRIGLGYGPANRPRIARRVVKRFAPLGVVIAGHCPPSALLHALENSPVHQLALNAPASRTGRLEAAYPANRGQRRDWEQAGTAQAIAAPADFLTLLVEAQVDPNFKSTVAGGAQVDLWWLQGLTAAGAEGFVSLWRQSPLAARGVLFVSVPSGEDLAAVSAALSRAGPLLSLGTWTRTPIAPGTCVIVDDPRWLPAVAAAASGIHLVAPTRGEWWQALASGAPVSVARRAQADELLNAAADEPAYAEAEDWAAVMLLWRAWRDDRPRARLRGDAARRVFWAERRRAAAATEDFLQRVFAW